MSHSHKKLHLIFLLFNTNIEKYNINHCQIMETLAVEMNLGIVYLKNKNNRKWKRKKIKINKF